MFNFKCFINILKCIFKNIYLIIQVMIQVIQILYIYIILFLKYFCQNICIMILKKSKKSIFYEIKIIVYITNNFF